MDTAIESSLKAGFKYLNRFMVLMWRLGLARCVNICPRLLGRIMIITHTGRKTGLVRRTPVNFAMYEGDIYCTAGFGDQSDWYRNILTKPQIEIWLEHEWWHAIAKDISDSTNRLPLLRKVLQNSGFAGYLAGIDAYKMSDEQLAAATKNYLLIRIRRTEAKTGSNGPYSLSWIWPLISFILLPVTILLIRQRKK